MSGLSERFVVPTALAALLFCSSPARVDAEGDAARGRVLADTCLGCHGIPDYVNVYPTYRVPKLGGQNEAYLVAALMAYKAGDRKHGTMQAQAHGLTEAEMQDIAAYFVARGKPIPEPEPGPAPKSAATCVACHGNTGISLLANYPNLAGQYEDYLEHALHAYKSGERNNAIMSGMVMALSDQDILELAEFYSAQEGLSSTSR